MIKSNSDLYLPITTKPNLSGQQRAMLRGLFAATDGGVDTRFACVRVTTVTALKNDHYHTEVFSERRNLPKAADVGSL